MLSGLDSFSVADPGDSCVARQLWHGTGEDRAAQGETTKHGDRNSNRRRERGETETAGRHIYTHALPVKYYAEEREGDRQTAAAAAGRTCNLRYVQWPMPGSGEVWAGDVQAKGTGNVWGHVMLGGYWEQAHGGKPGTSPSCLPSRPVASQSH